MKEFDSEFKRIASYLAIGGFTALLEVVVFRILYAVTNGNVALANISAVAISTCCNFALNRSMTFSSKANPVKSMVRYALLLIFNTFISTNAIALLISHSVSPTISKITMQGCIATWNYFIYKRFVFA